MTNRFTTPSDYRIVRVVAASGKLLIRQTMFCTEEIVTSDEDEPAVQDAQLLSIGFSNDQWYASIKRKKIIKSASLTELNQQLADFLEGTKDQYVVKPIRHLKGCPCKKGHSFTLRWAK